MAERDLAPYFIPPRFFWVESIKNWDFPLWNPYQFCGHPFFANPQNAILYPINILFFFLPFDIAFNVIIILHFFLAGLFTYLLARDLKIEPAGSLISGLILMLGGYLLSVHSLLNCLLSFIWTPLVIMFFRRALLPCPCAQGQGKRPGIRNEILTSIFITISFIGGGLEIVYGNFFILLFMVFIINFRTGIRSLLIIFIFFLCLSAIQLIPFLELYKYSIRGGGISYEEATTWSFAPKDILLFFIPDAYGYFLDMKSYWTTQCWLKTIYTGSLPFILSIIYFIYGKGRKLYSLLILFSIFLALGHYNPLYPYIFKYIPFFNGIRYPVKFLYIFILTFSITAGLGFQKLQEFARKSIFTPLEVGRRHKRPLLLTGFIIFSFITVFIFLFLVLWHRNIVDFLRLKGTDFPNYNCAATNLFNVERFFFYLLVFFFLLWLGQRLKWKIWIKGLLVFFLIADLFGNMGFYWKEKTQDYFKKTKIVKIISNNGKGRYRIFSTGKTISEDSTISIKDATPLDILKEKHLPSFSQIYHLHNIWGIDVVHLKSVDDLYHKFIGSSSISATNLVDIYGIKYVISIIPIDSPRYRLVYTRDPIKLYEVKKPFPTAWTSNDDKVNFISESNNRLTLSVDAKENSTLVLSDTYYPGWKAFIDGKEKKIYRYNYTFRAVPIEAGKHRIEFVYSPFSFKIGVAITLIGIIVCIGLLLLKMTT